MPKPPPKINIIPCTKPIGLSPCRLHGRKSARGKDGKPPTVGQNKKNTTYAIKRAAKKEKTHTKAMVALGADFSNRMNLYQSKTNKLTPLHSYPAGQESVQRNYRS